MVVVDRAQQARTVIRSESGATSSIRYTESGRRACRGVGKRTGRERSKEAKGGERVDVGGWVEGEGSEQFQSLLPRPPLLPTDSTGASAAPGTYQNRFMDIFTLVRFTPLLSGLMETLTA